MGAAEEVLRDMFTIVDKNGGTGTPPSDTESMIRKMREDNRLREEERRQERIRRREEMEEEAHLAEIEARRAKANSDQMLARIEQQRMLGGGSSESGEINTAAIMALSTMIKTLTETTSAGVGQNSQLVISLLDKMKADLDERALRQQQLALVPSTQSALPTLAEQIQQVLALAEIIRPPAPSHNGDQPMAIQIELRRIDLQIQQWQEENKRWWADFDHRRKMEEVSAKTNEHRFSTILQALPQVGRAISAQTEQMMAASGQQPVPPVAPPPPPPSLSSQPTPMAHAMSPEPVQVKCMDDGCDGVITFRDPESIMECPKCKIMHRLNNSQDQE